MIEEFAPGLWTVDTPLRIAGAELGTRMTIVRTGGASGDELVLIAPCPIDEVLETEIRKLGRVRAVIAPNGFHHFYFLDALARFAEARPFLAEGVAAKLDSVPSNGVVLSDEPDAIWKGALEQRRIQGAPKVNEVVFFHPVSRTLILTDLCFHFDPPPGGWTGLFLRLAGAHGKLAVSRLMRSLLKDREAARAAIREILAWDFDRIVLAHGHNVWSGAHARFEKATADL